MEALRHDRRHKEHRDDIGRRQIAGVVHREANLLLRLAADDGIPHTNLLAVDAPHSRLLNVRERPPDAVEDLLVVEVEHRHPEDGRAGIARPILLKEVGTVWTLGDLRHFCAEESGIGETTANKE